MPKKQLEAAAPLRSNNKVRKLLLQYFYDRNKRATSVRGKKGAAVKISNVMRELKAAHGLSQQEVLISTAWAAIKGAAVAGEFVGLIENLGHHVGPFLVVPASE
jgi:hypothetical protein